MMSSNGAPLYLWRRETQAHGAVRWYLFNGLRRTRIFIERPATAAERMTRSLPYVLCYTSGYGRGPTRDEAAYRTLELAKMGAD